MFKCFMKKDKILEFNQYLKPIKTPFLIYSDLESLSKKIYGYKNKNPEKSSSTKVSAHVPCG